MGEKCEIMRAKNPECSRRQVGDKCEIRRATALRASNMYRETSGDKPEVTRAKNPECSVVGDNWETSAKSCGPKHSGNPKCLLQGNKPGDKRRIMRPEHAPLSEEYKNPSQVNLFGEKNKVKGRRATPL